MVGVQLEGTFFLKEILLTINNYYIQRGSLFPVFLFSVSPGLG